MNKHATPDRQDILPAVVNNQKQIFSSASMAKIKSPNSISTLFKVRATKTPTAALLKSNNDAPLSQGYSSLATSSLRSLKNFTHFSRQNILKPPSPKRGLGDARVSCVVEIQALQKKPDITASHSTAALNAGGSPDRDDNQPTLKGKPRVLKGLPSAFNAREQKHSLSRLRGKHIENWSAAIDAQEYKQAQNLLSPMKLESDRRQKIEKTLNNLENSVLWKHASAAAKATRLEPIPPNGPKLSGKLARRQDFFFSQTPQNHSVCARIETPTNNNNQQPLMDMFADYKEPCNNNNNNNNNNFSSPEGGSHFSRSHTSSFSPNLDLNNLDFKGLAAKELPGFPSLMPRQESTASTFTQSGNLHSFKSLTHNKVRRDEMITVGVIKTTKKSGPVKKMLHVPTFKLYAVKQIPFSNREVRFAIKSWAMTWMNSMNACKYAVKLYATFWNHPEGWVSLVVDNMNGGSLENVLQSSGALPQSLLKQIAESILKALLYMHGKAKVAHGGITPSQILFDKAGKPKLGMGVAGKLAQKDDKLNYYSNCSTPRIGLLEQNRLSLYESNPAHSPSKLKLSHLKKQSSMKEHSESTKDSFSNDIFDLGYTLLVAATGGLQILGDQFFHQIEKGRGCCMLHMNSRKAGKLRLRHLLNPSLFSKEFLDFLCHCTRYDVKKRGSVHDLLRHQWLSQKSTSVKLKMQEMLNIANNWKKDAQLPIDCQGPSEKHLESLCNALTLALPSCAESTGSSDDLAAGYILEDPMIKEQRKTSLAEIAGDLGLDRSKVMARFEEALRQVRDKKFS